jgi:lipoprotein signal peptidase
MKLSISLFFIITTDILSKYWTHTQTPNISLVGDWVKIVLFKNTGIAFSTPLPGIQILIPLILLGLLGFIIFSWKNISENEKIGYSMIFTG